MKKHLAKNISGVSSILILTKGAALLISIILARTLSKADFGEFTLLRTLILLIPPLAIWGQDIATARFFSRNDPSQFRWDRAFQKIMTIAFPLVSIGVVVARSIYHLSFSYLSLLFISGIGYCGILLFTNLLRSQKRYHMAILLDSGFRLVFVLIILVTLTLHTLTQNIAITAYALCFPLFAIISLWYSKQTITVGNEKVPKVMHVDGLWLMLIGASVVIMASVDHLFISGMLSVEALGIYGAVVVPIHIFDILVRSTKFVLVPELGAQKTVRFKLYNIVVAMVATALLVIFLFGGKTILHLLYGSKFDEGLGILRILAVVGVLRLFYSLSSAMIVGRLGHIALKYHTFITVSAVILHIFLTFTLLQRLGLIGAPLAVLITTSLRVIGSYYVVRRFRYTEKETLVEVSKSNGGLEGADFVSAS